jgi:hypothetical protein
MQKRSAALHPRRAGLVDDGLSGAADGDGVAQGHVLLGVREERAGGPDPFFPKLQLTPDTSTLMLVWPRRGILTHFSRFSGVLAAS